MLLSSPRPSFVVGFLLALTLIAWYLLVHRSGRRATDPEITRESPQIPAASAKPGEVPNPDPAVNPGDEKAASVRRSRRLGAPE